MLELVPDAKHVSEIFSEAIVPTFFLGAIAAFVTLMDMRLSAVMQRVRTLNAIAENDTARTHLKSDLERLRRRARFLSGGIVAALYGGLASTLLLAILFLAAFFNRRAYGASVLFIVATFFLGFALLRFAQEARIGLTEADEHL